MLITHILRILNQYDFKENTDYFLQPDVRSKDNPKTARTLCVITPYAFKTCLIGSKNENKFRKYYLFLEKCIHFYNKKQVKRLQDIILEKDDSINKLSKEISEIKEINIQQTAKIDELLNYSKDTQDDLHTILDFTIEQVEQTETMKMSISDRINVPPNNYDIEQLVIFEKDSQLYVVRGTKTYVSAKCRQLCGKALTKLTDSIKHKEDGYDYTYLRYYKDVPNARHLFRVIKQQLGNKIKTKTNTIILEDISIDDILNRIQDIFDQRLTVNLDEDQLKTVKYQSKKNINEIKTKTKTLRH
jgi:hypothetical protein